MFETIFGSAAGLNPPEPLWDFRGSNPKRWITATSVEEVIPLLQTADDAARAGSYVAVMLSYEAAPAFDPAIKTHSPSEFPLAFAAVFSETSDSSSPAEQQQNNLSRWAPGLTKEEFEDSIVAIRELIAKGDTYQVNFTFPLTAKFHGHAKNWYDELCHAQQANYSVYLDLGRYKILSLSPELFFSRLGDAITTRPMKGTMRRGRWLTEDEEFAQKLAHSQKDRAENVMIVDLLRNDLGKVSLPGTVRVADLFAVERYPTLWQMTSTVEATLKPDTNLVEVMTALFPCGSITGAPKIRTTEIIKNLERGPRELYTGTIGLIRPGGDSIFNVAIRTLVLDSATGTAKLGVGAGITYDSFAESEYAECLLKGEFVKTSGERFELLESILLDNGDYFLLARHLDRLKASAHYFAYPYNETVVREKLRETASRHSTAQWKVRLILDASGEVTCSTQSLLPRTSILRVGVANGPVNSDERSLYHKKTTNLERWQAELREHPDWDDLILWNERGDITESTIANVVIRRSENLVTPPRESGLLSGTFREELLESGEIVESRISLAELQGMGEFYLINSVQKWRRAVLS